jgi:hypothetical protein
MTEMRDEPPELSEAGSPEATEMLSRRQLACTACRPVVDLVALLVLIGTIAYALGYWIDGASGEFSSGWAWDSAFGIADTVAAIVAAALVVGVRFEGTRRPAGGDDRARGAMFLALLVGVAAAVCSVGLGVEAFANTDAGYGGGTQVGMILEAVGGLAVAIAAVSLARYALGTLQARGR